MLTELFTFFIKRAINVRMCRREVLQHTKVEDLFRACQATHGMLALRMWRQNKLVTRDSDSAWRCM
jgi:hypothetical protein